VGEAIPSRSANCRNIFSWFFYCLKFSKLLFCNKVVDQDMRNQHLKILRRLSVIWWMKFHFFSKNLIFFLILLSAIGFLFLFKNIFYYYLSFGAVCGYEFVRQIQKLGYSLPLGYLLFLLFINNIVFVYYYVLLIFIFFFNKLSYKIYNSIFKPINNYFLNFDLN
jgi:hypothetical protein